MVSKYEGERRCVKCNELGIYNHGGEGTPENPVQFACNHCRKRWGIVTYLEMTAEKPLTTFPKNTPNETGAIRPII